MAMEELAREVKAVVESQNGPSPEDLATLSAQRAIETADTLDAMLEDSGAREARTLAARYRWAADHIGVAIRELQAAKGDMEELFTRWGVEPGSFFSAPPFQQTPLYESRGARLADLPPLTDGTESQVTGTQRPSAWTAEAAAEEYMRQRGSGYVARASLNFYIAPESDPVVRVSERDLFDPVVQQELDRPIETVITFPPMATDKPRKMPLGRVQKYGVFSVRDALLLGGEPFETWGVRVEPADAAAQLLQAVPDVPMEHPELPIGPAKAAQICERLDQIPIQVLNPRLETEEGRVTLADVLDPETGMPKIPPSPSEHKTRIKMGLPKGYGYDEYEAAVAYIREFRRVRRQLFGKGTA